MIDKIHKLVTTEANKIYSQYFDMIEHILKEYKEKNNIPTKDWMTYGEHKLWRCPTFRDEFTYKNSTILIAELNWDNGKPRIVIENIAKMQGE